MQRPDAGGAVGAATWARRMARRMALGADVTDAAIAATGRRVEAESAFYWLHNRPAFRARQARRGRLGAAVANDPEQVRGGVPASLLGGIASGVARRRRSADRDAEIGRRMMRRASARTSGAAAETVAAIAADAGVSRSTCYDVDRRNVVAAASAAARSSFASAPRSGASGSGAPETGSKSARRIAAAAAVPDPAGVAGRKEVPAAAGGAGDDLLLGGGRLGAPPRREAGLPTLAGGASRARAPGPSREAARAPPDAVPGLERPTDHPAADPPCAHCGGRGFVRPPGGEPEPCQCATGKVYAAGREDARRRKSRSAATGP